MPNLHKQLPQCVGEVCPCGLPATHKVGEEMMHPIDFQEYLSGGKLLRCPRRHEFTRYICCECFGRLMGIAATTYCERLGTQELAEE